MNELASKPIIIKRALISVSNKTGVVEFARALADLGIQIISTGGTSELLKKSQVPHVLVEEITGFTEMFEGRVKTLHPNIHGGILGKRDLHANEALKHKIDWIDLVVVNFYPFAEVVKNKEMNWDQVTEYIDIGGPTMVRAAAKNFAYVGVVVDPQDYEEVIAQLRLQQGLDFAKRKALSTKAFGMTAKYDAMVYQYFLKSHDVSQADTSPHFLMSFEKWSELRYGENPHQKACAYQVEDMGLRPSGILSAIKHQGKPLSYNNILDTETAFTCVSEFEGPACVIVKHTNPCGAAAADTIDEAYKRAYQADALSAFGGIIALNRPCTKTIATSITSHFVEVIIAPGFTQEALSIFKSKPNLRVIELPIERNQANDNRPWEMKFITGGVLLQEKNRKTLSEEDLSLVTDIKPTHTEVKDMLFAWRVLKHIKSNGILIVRDQTTIGIGAGQVSRIDAVDIAVRKGSGNLKNTILASDAFFPFRDSIDRLADTGISAIIQPGGSMRDDEVIEACNKHRIAMVFSGERCFRH
jgi:phosphoribosylaminoimidazolecarboxamide formyltransferase/IMP cyclohydrolase